MSGRLKHGKPKAFYDVFDRRSAGEKTTHYCAGCGHGTAHKLIAEAIDHFGIGDRTVFCSPVGCSVFAYYYMDAGNVQCSHGRAPAVATGIRRTLPGAVIISYQGDGDLAGIGTGEIIHAANRGENITVFFINNAIYGMTGGQMAPTTLLGQRTTTTPTGRTIENEGRPIGMAEVIASLKAPVFVERVSLGDAARVMRARRAVFKGLETQIQGKGFSFVEILSACPVGWKMTPVESCKWLMDNLEPEFPVRNFRDATGEIAPAEPVGPAEASDEECLSLFRPENDAEVEPRVRERPLEDQLVRIAGFGGQGAMAAGILLANCAIAEGAHAVWIPSYGPEMRGGTANASVIVSENPIGAPVVSAPNCLIALNGPSLDAFEPKCKPGGLVIVNSSLIERDVGRSDLRAIYLPATGIAQELGLGLSANVVAIGVYAAATGAVTRETLRRVIPGMLKKKELVELNLKALDAGMDFFRKQHPRGI